MDSLTRGQGIPAEHQTGHGCLDQAATAGPITGPRHLTQVPRPLVEHLDGPSPSHNLHRPSVIPSNFPPLDGHGCGRALHRKVPQRTNAHGFQTRCHLLSIELHRVPPDLYLGGV